MSVSGEYQCWIAPGTVSAVTHPKPRPSTRPRAPTRPMAIAPCSAQLFTLSHRGSVLGRPTSATMGRAMSAIGLMAIASAIKTTARMRRPLRAARSPNPIPASMSPSLCPEAMNRRSVRGFAAIIQATKARLRPRRAAILRKATTMSKAPAVAASRFRKSAYSGISAPSQEKTAATAMKSGP